METARCKDEGAVRNRFTHAAVTVQSGPSHPVRQGVPLRENQRIHEGQVLKRAKGDLGAARHEQVVQVACHAVEINRDPDVAMRLDGRRVHRPVEWQESNQGQRFRRRLLAGGKSGMDRSDGRGCSGRRDEAWDNGGGQHRKDANRGHRALPCPCRQAATAGRGEVRHRPR